MDIVDHKTADTNNSFWWFRAKKDLLDRLCRKLILPENQEKQNKQSSSQGSHAVFKPKILNLGAGTGDDLEVLNNYGSVYVVDISQEAIDLVPESLCAEKRVGDACKLPYKANTFDVVVALDVFEHIKDHEQAVSEAHRVLKKGGLLLFSVPAFQCLFSSHDKALLHERRYSKKELRTLMHKNNFHNLHLTYWNSTLFLPMALVRLLTKNRPAKTDTKLPPKPVNELLFAILKLENKCIEAGMKKTGMKTGLHFPPGLSIWGWGRKEEDSSKTNL